MSYDIRMVHPETKETLHYKTPHAITGGTYAVGGTTKVWLNITYNYSSFYRATINEEKGIRFIYGMTGKEAAPILLQAIQTLGTQTDEDYWKATPGNAGAALKDLLFFALDFPEGIFDGD